MQKTPALAPAARRYRDSKRNILNGLLLLGVGSLVLFACKLPLSETWRSLLALLGGTLLLLGNGLMIFGLLIFADARRADDTPTPPTRPNG